MRDPRLYQIATLTGLLAYGMAFLGFDVGLAQVALTLAAALVAQLALGRLAALPRYDPRSALISGLSLCLLLRTEQVWLAAFAALLAVGSKFVLRWNGKHVFNPTNIALVALLAAGEGWVSPGQWGSSAFFAFLMACLGGLVVSRALRSDVTAAFLASHLLLLFGRSWRLGDPLTIPLHQLQSGALLLFAFFMISDPKTTPDSRAGRVLFAALVAAGAYLVQFRLYRPNGLLWSLAACSTAVPLIDRLLPGIRYQWASSKGVSNEASADVRLLGAARAAAGPHRLGLLRLLRGQG
jgi:Na+-transporting NADH:ubiquinone oxidoreductase subunit NqrB